MGAQGPLEPGLGPVAVGPIPSSPHFRSAEEQHVLPGDHRLLVGMNSGRLTGEVLVARRSGFPIETDRLSR